MKVYTGGTFDLFHSGHVRFLRRASGFGPVTVALNRDSFIRRYKGSASIMSFDERAEVLLGCEYVERVIENSGDEDSRIAIDAVRPDLIAIGSDWATRDYYGQMSFDQKWLDEREIAICFIPYTRNISTSELKERMRSSGENLR